MPAQKQASFSREVMKQTLQQLGYLTYGFDAAEQKLFGEAWALLSKSNWVTLGNLITFLVAVDKIFFPQQQATKTSSSLKPQLVNKRSKFGIMASDGTFHVTTEAELSHIYRHFTLMSKNK